MSKPAAMVFLLMFVVLLWFHGNRLVLTNDEGILLEPAQRMAAGSRLYVDFFGYMTPGSYWLQAFMFRWLGVSLWAGRLPVILDFSLQCALVYWLTARLASTRAAVAVVLTFAGFQIADPAFLTAQHRWDSATLALAGLCVAVRGSKAGRRTATLWAASGALLAAAAWCTPSLVVIAVITALWLLLAPERRRAVIPFAGGVLAVTAIAVGALAASGSLAAFFEQLAWLRKNYAGINTMPYGSVIGGYRNLLQGADGPVELAVRFVLVACYALPAILPPAAFVLWGIALWRRKIQAGERAILQLLLLALAGLVVTAFPRADVMHLAFIAALPYILCGAAMARFVPARAGVAVACVPMVLAGVFAANYCVGWGGTSRLSTPVGSLRVATQQIPEFKKLLSEVRPDQGLFVYPYMPIHYFLTQAKNPTRFSYLQPGMMTDQDASDALGELRARPPQWLLYLRLSPDEFARIYPSAPPNLRFKTLEDWLENNYQPMQDPAVTVGGYRLWRRNPLLPAVAELPQFTP